MCILQEHSKRVEREQEPGWVYLPEIKGWVREHDPRTQSGLAPMNVQEARDEDS